MVDNSLDILCIAETKIDSSFPTQQFEVRGFKAPLRLDISDRSGGLLVYIRQGLSAMRLKVFNMPKDIQIIPFEMRLKSCKWIVISIYRPPKQGLNYFLSWLTKLLDLYSSDRCLVLGDFNSEPQDGKMADFLDSHNLYNHVKFNTCFKSVNGRCIDLILSNRKHSIQFTGSLNTGISDFHKLIYTVLKSTFIKYQPKEILYRSFKNYSEINFLADLSKALHLYEKDIVTSYDLFESIYTTVLDKHAPWKKKIVRGNEKPHMNKALKKAIMKRSKLWNNYCKTKGLPDLDAYKEQRNLVTKMNKGAKKLHFENALENAKDCPGKFWKICRPFMSNKGHSKTEITLKLNGPLVQDESRVSELMNSHFNTITKPLNLFVWNSDCSLTEGDPVLKAIKKYEDHPSILKIRSNLNQIQEFEFKSVTYKEVYEMIVKLDCSKKTSGSISNKILKSSINVICPFVTNIINHCIENCIFPDKLKLAEITPIPKAGDSQTLGDFRPISILPALSKLFEKVLANQVSGHFETIFCSLLCGFRKRHSTQHALLGLLRSWQKSLDEGKIVGTILMDISKTFDCLPHDLIIAKCAAYGVDFKSLSLLQNYLSNRYHRVKIGSKFSEWLLLIIGVPQGSVLGPLLFNVFLNDFFLFIKEASLCNFADDNSLYASAKSLTRVIQLLELETANALEWFRVNSIAANPAKFQLMFLGRGQLDDIEICINNITLRSKSCVKLLGVSIDCKLHFSEHVKTLCKSASSKIKALFRIRPYLNIKSAKKLCKAFILSSFNYCPLIWMYGCKSNDTLINKVHHRALCAIYSDFSSSFEALLTQDTSVSIHVQNLRILLIEICKIVNKKSPCFLWDMFLPKSNAYSLRLGEALSLPSTNTKTFGSNSIAFRGSLLWNNLPNSLKSIKSPEVFKLQIRKWTGQTCTCYICS